MSLLLLIYILDKLPDCLCFPSTTLILSSIAILFAGIFKLAVGETKDDGYNDADTVRRIVNPVIRYAKIVLVISLILVGLGSLLPSKEAAYTMVGVYLIDKTQIPDKVIKILNNKLDAYIVETGNNVKQLIKQKSKD